MIQLLASAFLLSIVHATIPNHWLPIVAIGKGESWSRSLTLRATLITGFAHIASTILIGLIVGWAGLQFATRYHSLFRIIAPSILVTLGIIYILLYLKNKMPHFHHHHHHHEEEKIKKGSVPAIIISLAVSMFFSPCIELETYYFKAGDFGWQGILSVSLIYLIVTVGMMVLLVYLALRGLAKLNLHSLEHNERLIIGMILILTGVLIVFI
jgi:nickel/cobalt transporter (NicO) family protein